MMWRYYELLTDVRSDEIAAMKQDAASGKAHPMALKKELARTIVADFHSVEAAAKAGEDWAKQFQKGGVPEGIEEVTVNLTEVSAIIRHTDDPIHEGIGQPLKLDKLLARAGLASSASEASRKIKERAVRVDGEVVQKPVIHRGKVGDPSFRVELIVRVGRTTKKVIVAA